MKKKKNKIIIITLFLIIIVIIAISVFVIHTKRKEGNEAVAIKLYEELIDTVTNNISSNDEYISIYFERVIDPLNKESLSKHAKDEILDYCKKYNDTVYNKSTDDLFSSGFGNENGLNGLSITLTVNSVSYNKANISVRYYRGNLSSGSTTYVVKYKDNNWKISKTVISIIS